MPRDLWLIFGDIRSHDCIEDAIVSGAADIVRLAKSDIVVVHDAMHRSDSLPAAIRNRSPLPFAGTASCIDDVQELAHRVNAGVGRCNDSLLNASRLLSDKEMMYRLLEAQGVHIPPRVVARDLGDLERILESLDAPLDTYILKPVVGTESRGVYRPRPDDTPSSVLSFLGRLADLGKREPVIVMPYVSAHGVSLEYCLDGVVCDRMVRFCAIHEKTRVYEAYPIHDRAMVTPPRCALDAAMVNAFLGRFAQAFPVDSFVFHLEARLDDSNRLVPIDLSLRPGGGLIFRSVMETYGVDLRLAHMYCCLGLDRELERIAGRGRKTERFAAIAGVFNNEQAPDVTRSKLAQVMGEADPHGRLVTYDLSNVSILSASSQSIKPNVGLCVTSTLSSDDAVAQLDDIVRRVAMSLTSSLEAEVVEQVQQGAAGGSGTEPGSLGDHLIHEVFAAQARKRPDAVALAQAGARLTYRELDEQSTVLANHLIARGAGLETRIGVHLERTFASVVTILAALKAGGCYVPLDVGYPRARLEYMLRDAGVEILVSTSSAAGQRPEFSGPIVHIDALELRSSVAENGLAAAAHVRPENLAYVVYTSGSTGQPKGVAVCHRSVTNLVLEQDYLDFEDIGCMLQAAPLSFDAATFELWGALLHGSRCALLEGQLPTVEQLRHTIESEGVDTAWFTASLFNTLVEDGPDVIGRLERVITGGEPLSARHVRRARQLHPHTVIINGYGPTETTTFACTHVCDGPGNLERVPIGRPLRNVDVLVLDSELNPVANGQAGELFIGGAGLARGYVQRPGLTAERFVPHPSGRRPGQRLYRTGDRVLLRSDGQLEFLGRLDRQVKLRGFRVELDEVEHVLLGVSGVQAAVASIVGNGAGEGAGEDPGEAADKLLVAHVVLASGGGESSSPDGIRAALAELVPAFMIPSRLMIVDELPSTSTGKLDRAAALEAPALEASADSTAGREPDRTDLDAGLIGIWQDVLGLTSLHIDDDFFERGGHSLSATRVVARIRNHFGLEVGLRVLFEHSKLGDFIAQVQALASARDRETGSDATGPVPSLPKTPALDQSRQERRKMRLRKRLDQLSDAEVSALLAQKRRELAELEEGS